MAALNRAWSLRCQVRSAGAGPVVEGLALAVTVRGGVSFPGGRYVAPIASATRRASPEFSEPAAGEHHEIVTSARYRGKAARVHLHLPDPASCTSSRLVSAGDITCRIAELLR